MIGDCGGGEAYALHNCMPYFQREDIRYILTRGQQGVKPAFCSIHFPHGGWSIMRSPYGEKPYENAGHLTFHTSQGAHGHRDLNAITAYAYGRELLIDPGIRSYEAEDIERYPSVAYHNTVCVDGKSYAARAGTTEKWISNDGIDYVVGSHSNYPGLVHRRMVLFVKPEYWMVLDEVTGQGEGGHTCDQNWGHFAVDAGIVFFEQSPMSAEELPAYRLVLEQLRRRQAHELAPDDYLRLLDLALRFAPGIHKMVGMGADLQKLLLEKRARFRTNISRDLPDAFTFYSSREYIYSQTILNNIFFGKTKTASPQAQEVITQNIIQLLIERDLLETIVEIGMHYNVGTKGDKLSGGQRQKLAIARVCFEGAEAADHGRGQVAPFGIKVSGIYPGPAETEFGTHLKKQRARERINRVIDLRMTSVYVARRVVDLAKRPRRSLAFPWWFRIITTFDTLFPVVVDWILYAFAKRMHTID